MSISVTYLSEFNKFQFSGGRGGGCSRLPLSTSFMFIYSLIHSKSSRFYSYPLCVIRNSRLCNLYTYLQYSICFYTRLSDLLFRCLNFMLNMLKVGLFGYILPVDCKKKKTPTLNQFIKNISNTGSNEMILYFVMSNNVQRILFTQS